MGETEPRNLLKVRRATVADADLLRLWNAKPHVQAAVSDDGQTGFGVDWDDELASRDVAYLIAEVDGRAIGALAIVDPANDPDEYWGSVAPGLRAIDIWIGEEAYLGRGFGTLMMRWTLARCFGEPGVTSVLVDPLARNTRVHRFYERLGFRFVERRQFDADSDCFVFRLDRARWDEFSWSATA